MTDYICKYCGLLTDPLAYHEGPQACQEAMRDFVNYLQYCFQSITPFCSCWEFDPYSGTAVDPHEMFKDIARRIGFKEEKDTVYNDNSKYEEVHNMLIDLCEWLEAYDCLGKVPPKTLEWWRAQQEADKKVKDASAALERQRKLAQFTQLKVELGL